MALSLHTVLPSGRGAWRAAALVLRSASSRAAATSGDKSPQHMKVATTERLISIPDLLAGHERRGCVKLSHIIPNNAVVDPTPVFALGGTAQTVKSFKQHTKHFAQTGRSVFNYETRGQGIDGTLATTGLSLEACADDLRQILDALGIQGPVDLVGFSFGARVAMAFAADYPSLVRRVVLSGVSANRGSYGQAIVDTWRTLLNHDKFLAMAHHMIQSSYTPEFFKTLTETELAKFANDVVTGNTLAGIRAIVSSQYEDATELYSNVGMATRIAATKPGKDVLLLNADQDNLAPLSLAMALADIGSWQRVILSGAAHGMLQQQPLLWRRNVMHFLNTGIALAEEPDLLTSF